MNRRTFLNSSLVGIGTVALNPLNLLASNNIIWTQLGQGYTAFKTQLKKIDFKELANSNIPNFDKITKHLFFTVLIFN